MMGSLRKKGWEREYKSDRLPCPERMQNRCYSVSHWNEFDGLIGGVMSIVAPQGRKHLCADALFRLVRSGLANIAEHCSGDAGISLTDALMSAFAMFSLKSPSLLAFDKQRAEGN